jgi:CHC2 zinc finger
MSSMSQHDLSHSGTCLTPHSLERYRSLFVGRTNDFALQRDNGRYVRLGRPLTNHELCLHLTGMHTIGTYVINEQGHCHFAVFDADSLDGLNVLRRLQWQLAHDGVVSYLEASRRGGHLWVFLLDWVPASQLRAWLLPSCPQGVEFYPKQDEGNGYGSLIRLPLGIHRISQQRYPFVRWTEGAYFHVAPTLSTLLTWLDRIERVPVPAPYRERDPDTDARAHTNTHPSLASCHLHLLSYSIPTIHAWCAMQDPYSVIGRYVHLDSRGLGCCPFGEHHAHGKDRHPSLRVYEPTRIGGSCWYCYSWGKGGNIFDFLCHWYKLDARPMWQQIQAGGVL